MKQTLLFMLLLTGLSSYAAPLNRKNNNSMILQTESMRLPVLQQQIARAAHKPTAVQRRLIASNYLANGAEVDSNRYYYSNGRGSSHSTPGTYFISYGLTSYRQEQYIQCDSAINWHNNGGGLDYSGTTTYAYNAQNKVTMIDSRSPYFAIQYAGTYNSSGKLSVITILDTFGGTAMIPKSNMHVVYDGQGKRVLDSTVNISTGVQTGKRTYTYDSNDNLQEFSSYRFVSGAWQLSFRDVFTYDSQDRVITETSEGDYGNGFMMQQKDSFAYTGTAVQPVYHLTSIWDDNNSIWDPYEALVYTLNTQSLPDTYIMYRHITTQWDTIERDVYTYDTHGLMVRSNGYLYTGNGQFNTTPYDQTNLYYEEYYPAGVHEMATEKRAISIYPNPATGRIELQLPETSEITITGINGQTLHREQGIPAGNKQINIENLPAGNYIVNIIDKEGAKQYGQFVKQ